MTILIKKFLNKVRIAFFPSKHELEVRRWRKDGGDEKYRYSFDLTSDSIVFDLGGYKGQWASDIYSMYLCKIFVFEPAKEFAKNIEIKFLNNKNIQIFNFALGSNKREEIILMDADGSSIFGKTGSKEVILFEDITTFLRVQNINKISLMKINIEGGEYELLSRLIETGDIKKIKQLQIQFHDISYNSISLMNKIKDNLKKTHQATFEYDFVWENWVLL